MLAEQGMSIACTRCEADNPPGARFCMRCGAALPVRCPHCGALLPPDARFCTQCGQPVRAGAAQPDEAPSAGERRLATVVMADVKGSTALAERIDTETWVEIMHGVFQVLDVEVYRYGGQIDQYRGDGLVAFFGVPIAHEDDPERAVRAALAMQEAIERYAAAVEEKHRTQGDPITLQLRIGVNTGEVVVASVGDRRWHTEDTAMGRAVALAARMETAAAPGTVLVTEHTYRLVAPLFEWEALGQTAVKGVSQPLSVYRPLAAKAVAGKVRGIEGLESPIVGRDAEIRALEGAIARLQSGMGGIVTVVGDAGIGKSRLVAEIRKHNLAKGAFPSQGLAIQWVEGRCLSYGGSIAYSLWPDLLRGILDLPRDAAAVAGREALRGRVEALCPDCFGQVYPYLCRLLSLPLEDRYASIRDLQGESLHAEVFWAVQAVVERAARQRPLLVACEDLHWADPTSLELLERLLALTDQVPLLLLCVLRPERGHGCWRIVEVAGRDYAHRHTDLRLGPLSLAESEALVGNLLRVEDLPGQLRERVLDHAEGNPFYIEEILRSLIDGGVIAHDEAAGRWRATRDVRDIPIPDTLHGALSARIDRLQEETRRVLKLASVVGRIFSYPVLSAIYSPLPAARSRSVLTKEEGVGGEGERTLDAHLIALQRAQLIRERARVPEREYIFKHQLTQEAAYDSLLRRERCAYHRQVAEALERLYPERLEEQLGLLAQHWEGAEEPERAIEYLLKAGEQARVAYANEEAVAHFRRALSLLDGHGLNETHSDWRLAALRGLGVALYGVGRADEAEALLREAIAIGKRTGLEAHALVRLYYWLGEVRYWQGDQGDLAAIGEEGLSLLGEDEESVESALMMAHLALGLRSRLGSWEKYQEWSLRAARFVDRLPYEEELRPVYNHIMISHRRLKEIGAAARWIAGLEKRATAHRDLRGVAEAAMLRSMACYYAGDLRGATAGLSQSAVMFGRLGDRKCQARDLAATGELCLELGDLDGAEEAIAQTVAIAGNVPFCLISAVALDGEVATCRGEWQAAMEGLEKAAGMVRELSWPDDEAYLSHRLGLAALAQGDRRRAVDSLQKSVTLMGVPFSIEFPRLLPSRLGTLEAAWQDSAAFRAFCRCYQEEHPEIQQNALAQWWLEPAEAADLSGLQDLTGLDAPGWSWHDSFGDCAYALDGGLIIHAANGRDMWNVNWSAPRLMRAVSGDLVVQTTVGPALDDRPTMGGLLLWIDKRNYLGLQWGTFGPGQVALEGAIENVDVVIGRGLLPEGAQERAFLRLERRGEQVAAFCSADGEAWFSVGQARFPGGPAQVGLYAIGSIDRGLYPGAYPEGTAIRFERFALWEG